MTTVNVESLQKKVLALEQKLAEKDAYIAQLQREVPGLSLKLQRLNVEESLLKHPDPSPGEPFWTAARVRDTFVSFFESKYEHTHWRSSSVVPRNDPTLLFINAGMNQFKPIFLGQVDPNNPMSKLKRACNSQKCIRAGGKHNDLEDVGKDVYHHTFFEMLGNWSFGDYFKEEAISWAWELLTVVYKIPGDRLYVTYFEGDNVVPRDDEAKSIWKRYVSEDRILPGNAKDNFWEMGETGPCGPCSEIHFDRIGGRNAAHLVNKDDPDVLEVWNLVFMEYNRKVGGSLEKLPAQSVDTGMGFERLTSVLQNKRSNYDTDVFMPIFAEIEKKVGIYEDDSQRVPRRYTGKISKADVGNVDMAYRVLADHIRTLTVSIADGALPSNEGRGYVLRRIIRRAVRYAREVLKMPKQSFSSLVPIAIKTLEVAFPDLNAKEKYVMDVLKEEEAVFERTLKKGVEYFEKQTKKMLETNEKLVKGELVFKLYESMGFPKDLTQLMAQEKGLEVDLKGYEVCMKRHVELSKGVKKNNSISFKVFESKETSELEQMKVKPTRLTFYEEVDIESTIMAIYDSLSEKFVSTLDFNQSSVDKVYGIILNQSSMYYESGGQIGDEGKLKQIASLDYHAGEASEDVDEDKSSLFEVHDVQNSKGFVVHIGKIVCSEQNLNKAKLKVGDVIRCCVDYEKREKTKKNHTATHVLNWGLRELLKTEVDQAGSLVNDEYLRFDFTNKSGLSLEDICKLESLVQDKIERSEKIDTAVVSLADTKKIKSLRAVFGETYPDPVRVVAIGCSVKEVLSSPEDPKWMNFSIELCGGTHVSNSSSIRRLVVMSEEAKGKNIRRIVCLTDEKALKAWAEGEEWYTVVERSTDDDVKALTDKINNAEIPVTQRRDLLNILSQRKLAIMENEKKVFNSILDKCVEECQKKVVAGEKVQLVFLDDSFLSGPKLITSLSKKMKDVSLVVVVKGESSITLAINVDKIHEGKVDGKKMFDRLQKVCEIKGGGKSTSMVGTTQDVERLPQIITEIKKFIAELKV